MMSTESTTESTTEPPTTVKAVKADKPFYHEITCKCQKYSYIDNFKTPRDPKWEDYVCEECDTRVTFLKVRRCKCGNYEGIACLDPDEECDICNGNMEKADLDEPNPEFMEGIKPFLNRRDEANRQEAGMKLMEVFTSLDLGEEPDLEVVKELKALMAKISDEMPEELKFLFALLDNRTNPRAALDEMEKPVSTKVDLNA
jgi:hypothetical protein